MNDLRIFSARARAELEGLVYEVGEESRAGSYSKIKVVRYHTMDSAYSPENSDAFLREAGD
jgi:hypothetical protein